MKNNKNLIGKNLGRGNAIAKEDLIKMLDILSREISPNMTSYLDDIIKTIKSKPGDKDLLAKSLAFSSLGMKDDIELLSILNKIMINYSKNISNLKSAIDEELPEIVPTNSSNLNVKLAMSLVNVGLFFGYKLPLVCSYMLTRYYLPKSTNSTTIYKSVAGSLSTVASLIKDNKKADFKPLVELIGKFPVMRNISSNKTDLPSSMVIGYMKSNLGVTAKPIVNFVVKSLNLIKSDYKKFRHSDKTLEARVGTVGFIGNPIYAIRIFLTDLEISKYETLKDQKRLLELKIAELKTNSGELDDPKLINQIDYYQTKLEKTEMKLDSIMEDSRAGRRNN